MKSVETKLPAKANKTWGTVGQAAAEALFDIGESTNRMEQFMKWGLDAARDWHFDMAKEVKTVKLKLNAYKAVDLPDDYVDWVRVGLKEGNMIRLFDHDPGISLLNDCEDGDPIENVPDAFVGDFEQEYDPFFNPQFGDEGRLFGLQYKHNGLGYFRFHKEAGQIQFRSVTPTATEIYFEYISDGWEPCSETLLHPYAFKLVQLYMHWMNIKFKNNRGLGEVVYAEQQYWNEHSRVQARMFDLTVEDILDAHKQAYTLSPKI